MSSQVTDVCACLVCRRGDGGQGSLGGAAIERQLAIIWAEILEREHVRADDDFFALGGDSLAMVALVLELSEVWEVHVPLQTLFEAPTVRDVAAEIAALLDQC